MIVDAFKLFGHQLLARARFQKHEQRILRLASGCAALCYHRVIPDDASTDGIKPGMYVRASTFKMHLDCLKQYGSIVKLEALVDGAKTSPGPRFAVTFDDGWLDNAQIAWPILQGAGVTAKIFLVKSWINGTARSDEPFMRPEQVSALAAEGLSFGAHSVTHPHFDTVPEAQAIQEMEESKAAVEAWSSTTCTTFAFPYGSHNQNTLKLARERFDSAWLTGDGWVPKNPDLGGIPRICMHEDMTSTPELFVARLAKATLP